MMPLEIQLQTGSPSGVVMIRAVGKLLIWKQRVRGVTKSWTKAEAVLGGVGHCYASVRSTSAAHASHLLKQKKGEKDWEETQTRLVSGANESVGRAISNDERLPRRQKLERTDPTRRPNLSGM